MIVVFLLVVVQLILITIAKDASPIKGRSGMYTLLRKTMNQTTTDKTTNCKLWRVVRAV